MLPSPPTSYNSNGIASGNGRTIITGRSNTAYLTTDAGIAGFPGTAIAWTKVNPMSRTADLWRVRYLNDRFIVTTSDFADNTNYNHAFHYSAATQTYTLLGNVPNAGNAHLPLLDAHFLRGLAVHATQGHGHALNRPSLSIRPHATP